MLGPYLAPLQAALGYTGGSHTLEDVRKELADGQLQLWPGPRSFILTRLGIHPSGQRVAHVFCMGGVPEELAVMRPVVEAWAKSQGCTRMTALGRRGWERHPLLGNGWSPTMTWFEKEL
ncbi:MAG TPA: hypothetical protein VFI41_12705 [Gemmatimonadales bacterium]|nr:hypothetical protein [Gemmatimonadales bacterium]